MDTNHPPQLISMESALHLLPHKYPLLLIDRVIELDPGKRAVCIKNLTINDWYFTGHYPGHPVMPGMLIVEALAQAGGVLILSAIPRFDSAIAYFSSMDGVRFRRPVVPGDQLRLEATLIQVRNSVFRFRGEASVDGRIASEAEMTVSVRFLPDFGPTGS